MLERGLGRVRIMVDSYSSCNILYLVEREEEFGSWETDLRGGKREPWRLFHPCVAFAGLSVSFVVRQRRPGGRSLEDNIWIDGR